ncbi:hypothetical protein J4424_04330 [Candidatus Woesearchaeota archaeon]|nr:hypothetical protein [Candidatus Woesearchaeota archaeon]
MEKKKEGKIMYQAFRTERYEKEYGKLDYLDQGRIIKFEQKLKKDHYSSKPLGYIFFREKKCNDKRLLFLIYEEYKTLFFVAITNKKIQQININSILKNLDNFKEEIKRKLIFF